MLPQSKLSWFGDSRANNSRYRNHFPFDQHGSKTKNFSTKIESPTTPDEVFDYQILLKSASACARLSSNQSSDDFRKIGRISTTSCSDLESDISVKNSLTSSEATVLPDERRLYSKSVSPVPNASCSNIQRSSSVPGQEHLKRDDGFRRASVLHEGQKRRRSIEPFNRALKMPHQPSKQCQENYGQKKLKFGIDAILSEGFKNQREKVKFDESENWFHPFVGISQNASLISKETGFGGEEKDADDEAASRKRQSSDADSSDIQEATTEVSSNNQNDSVYKTSILEKSQKAVFKAFQNFRERMSSLEGKKSMAENTDSSHFGHYEQQLIYLYRRRLLNQFGAKNSNSVDFSSRLSSLVPPFLPYYMTPHLCTNLYRYYTKMEKLSGQERGTNKYLDEDGTGREQSVRKLHTPMQHSSENEGKGQVIGKATGLKPLPGPDNYENTTGPDNGRKSVTFDETNQPSYSSAPTPLPYVYGLRHRSVDDRDLVATNLTGEHFQDVAKDNKFFHRSPSLGNSHLIRNLPWEQNDRSHRFLRQDIFPMTYAAGNSSAYSLGIAGINTSSISGVRVPFLRGIESLGQDYGQWTSSCAGRFAAGPKASYDAPNHFSGGRGIPGGAVKKRRKWNRAVFSTTQRRGLEKSFEKQKYVAKPERKKLAETLHLTDAQVKIWFQNRRMKWRQEIKMKDRGLVPTSNNSKRETVNALKHDELVVNDEK